MKKNIIIAGIIVIVAIIILIVISKVTSKKDIANLYAESEKGQFDIVVTTTGELEIMLLHSTGQHSTIV